MTHLTDSSRLGLMAGLSASKVTMPKRQYRTPGWSVFMIGFGTGAIFGLVLGLLLWAAQ